MKKTLIGAVVVLLFAGAANVTAQDVPTLWDTPTFMGPRPGSDLGVYLIDADFSDVGIQGIWRTSEGTNLGLRAGFLDTPGDEIITLGVETWDDIAVQDADFPLDLSWTAGAGVWLNGSTVVSVPVGVSIGRTVTVEDSNVSFQLYGHPRIALAIYENAVDDLELDLGGIFDLGADIYLSSNFAVEVAASFGDFDAVGIGLAWRQ